MPFDYEANVAAVKSVLDAHNTTTASPDLSSGLTTRVKAVYVDDPDVVSVQWTQLPAVYIRIQQGEEEAASLGPTGPTSNFKTKWVNYEVIGLYLKDGVSTAHSSLLTQSYRLAENLEGVFQTKLTLSGTALWCHPVTTSFGAFGLGEGVRAKGFMTTLRARYHFR